MVMTPHTINLAKYTLPYKIGYKLSMMCNQNTTCSVVKQQTEQSLYKIKTMKQ